MSDPFPTRIGFAEAVAHLRDAATARRLPPERIPLSRARGRVLAADIAAPMDLPSFDNAAMDGFALRAADTAGGRALRLVGEQFAGRAGAWRLGAGECLRITTGAVLPDGADAVLMKEQADLEGAAVQPRADVRVGQHVRRRSEDVAAGEHVLAAGQVLTPARLALLAALGLPEVEVATRPTVAVFTTGDELRRPGEALAPGEIYDSNRVLLMALLAEMGLEPMALPALPDDPGRMRAALEDAAGAFDVVVTCGGVSAGEKDHLPELLREHGRIHFWKVRMKPGMPVLFGAWQRALVLGLPGNPVSVMATCLTLGRALFSALQGGPPPPKAYARLAGRWDKRHERLEFLRGRLAVRPDGTLLVAPNPADGSHRMRAAADSDALIVLDEGLRTYPQDAVVEILRY